MTRNTHSKADERGSAASEKTGDAERGNRVRPGETIREEDRRVGRKIKQEQPSGAEPGYANTDNLPNR
jgi:hypothetical protein